MQNSVTATIMAAKQESTLSQCLIAMSFQSMYESLLLRLETTDVLQKSDQLKDSASIACQAATH